MIVNDLGVDIAAEASAPSGRGVTIQAVMNLLGPESAIPVIDGSSRIVVGS